MECIHLFIITSRERERDEKIQSGGVCEREYQREKVVGKEQVER